MALAGKKYGLWRDLKMLPSGGRILLRLGMASVKKPSSIDEVLTKSHRAAGQTKLHQTRSCRSCQLRSPDCHKMGAPIPKQVLHDLTVLKDSGGAP